MSSQQPAEEPELEPMGRYEWERLVRRVAMPKPLKLVALLLATWSDPDGTRVRPGTAVLAAVTGDTERTITRLLAQLRGLGLVKVVSRGGGRAGRGKATEYRLCFPTDLLERVRVLRPDFTTPSGSPDWEDTQMSPEQPVDNSGSEDIQVSSEPPVDNAIERTSGGPEARLRGHLAPIERTSGCPTTSHDQPPRTTNPPVESYVSTVPIPGAGDSVDDPRTDVPPTLAADAAEPGQPPAPGRCVHGLDSRIREDGLPACAFCRRGARALQVVNA